MNTPAAFSFANRLLEQVALAIQPVVLLAVRLYWGWSFFVTGRGKLEHLDKITEFFASLHIPMPHVNALIAGCVECVGGLLIAVGLLSRFAAIPLIFTLCVAYATAERESLQAIFSDPDKFTGATPFLFLVAMVIIFAFGPGPLSLDRLLFGRKRTVEVNIGATLDQEAAQR